MNKSTGYVDVLAHVMQLTLFLHYYFNLELEGALKES